MNYNWWYYERRWKQFIIILLSPQTWSGLAEMSCYCYFSIMCLRILVWLALFMDHKLWNFTCGFTCRFFSSLRGENCGFYLCIFSPLRGENYRFVPVYFFAASRRKLYILPVYFFRRFAAKTVYFTCIFFSEKNIPIYMYIFPFKKTLDISPLGRVHHYSVGLAYSICYMLIWLKKFRTSTIC